MSFSSALRPALFVFGALLALDIVSGCHRRSGASSGGALRDARVEPAARRIVSLVPSATETLYALGAGDRIVGGSGFDDYPPEAAHLPAVGGMISPSFEAIVALHPDALVGVQGPINRAVIDRVHAMGVRVLFPEVESIAEVQSSIDLFAALVHREEAAQALHARIAGDIARVRTAVRGKIRPRVLAVFSQRPMVVAGPGSWFDEILAIAGGDNVVPGTSNRYPMASIEQVLGWSPEYVIDLTWHENSGTLADAWATRTTVPAVRDHHVVRIANPVLIRQGPRIGEAATILAHALHPDAVPNSGTVVSTPPE